MTKGELEYVDPYANAAFQREVSDHISGEKPDTDYEAMDSLRSPGATREHANKTRWCFQ